jgi:multiple antibiotic resistance protein
MNHHAGGLFSFDPQEIFTFLFIMLGPIKLLVPFAKITKSSTEAERRSLALQGTLLATLTVIAASFVGVRILAKWGVAPGSLALAGGVLFFLVALSMVLKPYTEHEGAAAVVHPPAQPEGATAAAGPPVKAMVRELVPNIVTPYGIAAVIFLITLMPESSWSIVAILMGIMALDLVAMIFARTLLRVLGFPLQILSTVMGVLQVALSVQMIVYGIRLLLVEKFGVTFPTM